MGCDLMLERTIDAPREDAFQGWTLTLDRLEPVVAGR